MCDDCVYPQARVAKNYGATKEEILKALNVAVLTGGMHSWSAAKGEIARLFEEWDGERSPLRRLTVAEVRDEPVQDLHTHG